jgi:undecaprenyl phosphate N,N'-diacetylbacillosamine 1-phosphate transferase
MNIRLFQISIKYFIDRIVGVLLFIAILIIFIPISIAKKIEDGGSVFFRQKRPGLYGKPFYIWKFRTMIPNADTLLDGNNRINQGINRVTRIGRILRYLSLDELPQIINIVKGEMSFIGPRPALYESMEKYTEKQKERFLMKPGITGLAQVNGRNLLKWSKRIEYDLQYIENYSLWLDIKILLKTIKVVLLREGIVLDRNPDEVDDLGKQK